jgi:hypothetical protein
MPRALPPLSKVLEAEIIRALDLAERLEQSRVRLTSDPSAGSLLTITAVELSYELSFLRVFIAWEDFLEACFFRLLCGYLHSNGQEQLVIGRSFQRTLRDAESAVLAGRKYVLWHNADDVVRRAQHFFVNGRHEVVLSSNLTRLKHFGSVRHRIAHSQEHARANFDAATMALCGRRYRASRPGRFLRDWASTQGRPRRYLAAIANELLALARQMDR